MDDIKSKAAELEAIISSVLISNPRRRRMTIRDLDRQFKELNGYRIPFSELGYCTLESYLHSIPHRLIVNGRGYDAELCLIVSQKSAHLYSLDRKQRSPKRPQTEQKSVPFVQRRRSEEFHLRKSPDNNIENVSSTVQNNTTPNVQHIPTLSYPSLRRPHKIFESVPSTSQNIQNPSMVEEKISNRVNPIALTSKGAIPKNYDNKNNSTTLKKNVPYYIQNRLKELIRNYPEGVHSRKLTELYKKEFKQDLNYSDYGYKSINHFCLALKTIFAFKPLVGANLQIYGKDLNLKLDPPLRNKRSLNDNEINLTEMMPEKNSTESSESNFDDLNQNTTTKACNNEIEEKNDESALENEIKITFHNFGPASLHIVIDTDDKY
ncbi:tudor domain-containing protein 7B-like [Onthophagus taurus]|uniref:tudor domain-containing protein 7B-like n=1 Tax=Onthophagus taurus TaxID=166361 RepID=UPI0039BDFD90